MGSGADEANLHFATFLGDVEATKLSIRTDADTNVIDKGNLDSASLYSWERLYRRCENITQERCGRECCSGRRNDGTSLRS